MVLNYVPFFHGIRNDVINKSNFRANNKTFYIWRLPLEAFRIILLQSYRGDGQFPDTSILNNLYLQLFTRFLT